MSRKPAIFFGRSVVMIASMSKIIEKDIKVVEEIKQEGWWLALSFSRLVVANAVVHLLYVSYLKNLSLNKDYWVTWVMLCEYEHIKWRCSTLITTKSLTLRNMISGLDILEKQTLFEDFKFSKISNDEVQSSNVFKMLSWVSELGWRTTNYSHFEKSH